MVAKYLRLAAVAGLTWPLPDDLDDAALEKLLYRQRDRPRADLCRTRLRAGSSGTEEERRDADAALGRVPARRSANGGYQYTAFCTRYRDWAGKLKRSMRQIHRAGEKLFADYAGPTCRSSMPHTGEIRPASIFVAVLGASSYTFACATPGQTQADWLSGLGRALTYIGGVTELIVPDNPARPGRRGQPLRTGTQSRHGGIRRTITAR